MIYALGIVGVIGLILFLLWMWEKAKHDKTKLQKGIAESRVAALNAIRTLEQQLQGASRIDQKTIKAKIDRLKKQLAEAKEGEIIKDFFGTGGESEGGAP